MEVPVRKVGGWLSGAAGVGVAVTVVLLSVLGATAAPGDAMNLPDFLEGFARLPLWLAVVIVLCLVGYAVWALQPDMALANANKKIVADNKVAFAAIAAATSEMSAFKATVVEALERVEAQHASTNERFDQILDEEKKRLDAFDAHCAKLDAHYSEAVAGVIRDVRAEQLGIIEEVARQLVRQLDRESHHVALGQTIEKLALAGLRKRLDAIEEKVGK